MYKRKQATISKARSPKVMEQAGILNTYSGTKETMVARSGDIPAAQKLAILNMLQDKTHNEP